MPQPGLRREIAEETVRRVEEKLREGFRPQGMTGVGDGAIAAAASDAIRDGFCNTIPTFIQRVTTARQTFGITPDWTLYRPVRYQQPVPRATFIPAAPYEPQIPTEKGERVLVIGDLHQDPAHPERIEVLKWIARYASAERFPRIIQIGDFSTWDSCSFHAKNDTLKARLKPSIKQDQDNLVEALRAWRENIAPDYKPKQIVLLGNHEARVWRFEDANPESVGIHTGAMEEAFLQFGWKTRPYGEIFYVEGVGFTHHPTNGAGRAYGGKTGAQRAANDSGVSIVGGHTHRFQVHTAPKIGPVENVTVVEVGCALPWGSVEAYAQHSATGWNWGVVDMTVCSGMITDVSFVSMLTLQRLYGTKAA